MATYAATTEKQIKKAVEKVKAHPEYRIEDQIRVVGKANVKDEIAILLTIENLPSIENLEYKDWITQRLWDLYPTVMARYYGERPIKKVYVPVEEKK